MASNFNGRDIAYIATSIAVAVSKQLTVDELNILGNVVTQVGATMLSIAAIEQSQSDAASSVRSDGNHKDTDSTAES